MSPADHEAIRAKRDARIRKLYAERSEMLTLQRIGLLSFAGQDALGRTEDEINMLEMQEYEETKAPHHLATMKRLAELEQRMIDLVGKLDDRLRASEDK